ncbi:MAG TPA: hypothetical protein VJK52_04480, partial [Candidatus Nanoarchaeia archaeon]|nr:hypothetical protein [Candidatus Nanoarchaeia archaeon]
MTYRALVTEAFYDAKRVFKADEYANRDAALKGVGLEGRLKAAPEQTVARSDVIAVLPMAKTNTDKARKIYHAAGLNPIIESLKPYAIGGTEDLPNAFGESAEAYRTMFDQLRSLVPRAVDKAIEHYEATK